MAEAEELAHVHSGFARLIVVGLNEQDEAIGFGEGERAKEQAVDDGEDGGVRADAERQGEDRDGGEARRLSQGPKTEAEVLPQGFHRKLLG